MTRSILPMRPPMRVLAAVVAAIAAAACGDDADYFSTEELMDPASCEGCHPNHYREWSGSMHAYAADDPVFLAMNARGQEETGGELGDFCVSCHAPMAVRLGLTTDGLNLADVPQWAKGVTCFFCHSVDRIEQDHNNGLVLASDGVLRGGLRDPVPSPRHRSAYSELLDSASQASSAMCGSCHDVVTPAGVHLERTFAEWSESIFGQPSPRTHLSCSACHMAPYTGVVAEAEGVDVPLRQLGVRDHKFVSVDVALTPWPERDAQLEELQRFLDPTVLPRICVTPENGGQITVRLDNVAAGHAFPSGAAHDRRAWLEIHAYDADGVELFASGVVPDGVDPEAIGDPFLWEMRELVYDDQGNEVKYFWEVRETDHSELLRFAVTIDPNDPRFDHATTKAYPANAFFQDIARVTVAVRLRPLPFALLEDLMASGHLTIDVRDQLPTFTPAGSVLEWREELADLGGCVNP